MTTFFTAFTLIFLAEMGDKTQLLALAFSTKFKMRQVMAGVVAGSFLNHGIAIALASVVSGFASESIIKTLASVLFIFFGLWSMKLDFEDEDEEDQKLKFGPVLTVALAFFVGELGDKTQMSAMVLGLDSASPFITLLGTTTGMAAVSLVGIIAGKLIGKKIPEVTMKFIAAIVFLGFGIAGLVESLPKEYLTAVPVIAFAAVLAGAVYLIYGLNMKNRDEYYGAKLEKAIARCRRCQVHDSSCQVGLDIENIAKSYIGADVPYAGRVIQFFESMKKASPKNAKTLSECQGKFPDK
ncbi:TMEM165/GDT1 family protein [Proteocatella sphenisci]|uniref:TMEM165/GDT1 family protein n=1 Tax=Proteocatella sphenisci TaxID=181070 RepID=UPI0004B5A58B|nr:TMEM165/GDT1 family protein [Proteocatella sphenisci]